MSQSGSATGGGGGGGNNVKTLTGNTGGAVGPTGGNINVVGSGTISVAGNPGTSTLTISNGGAVADSFPTDAGTAIPSSGVLNIDGGSNINTAGSGNTVTVNLDDTVSISGSMTAGTGFTATTGDVDIVAGNLELPIPDAGLTIGTVIVGGSRFLSTDQFGGGVYLGTNAGSTSSVSEIAIGLGALATDAGGGGNIAIGTTSMGIGAITGSQNNGLGTQTLSNLTTGTSNNAVGSFALNNVVTGEFNIAIGDNAGTAYASNESDNIIFGYNVGTVGDSGVIRIGATGGGHPQTSCFIAGIRGVTPVMTPEMVTIGSDGELGSATLPVAGIDTLDGDTGSATGSTVTIAGGSNITTSATGSTLTVDLDSTVSITGTMTADAGLIATAGNLDLPATNNGGTHGVININGSPFIHNYGVSSVVMGNNCGNTSTMGGGSVAIGVDCMPANNGANNCIAIGNNALHLQDTGNNNVAIGNQALASITTGGNNTALGNRAGVSYTTGTEQFNTLLANTGVNGESFAMRLGDPSFTFSARVAGVYPVTSSGNPFNVACIASDDQLFGLSSGTDGQILIGATGASPAWASLTAGSGISITPGANSISIAATGGGSGITTLDGDSGSATGATVTIAGGSNITTSASGATVTVDLDSTVSIGGSMTAGTGFTATTGDVTVSAGNIALPNTNLAGTHGVLTIGGSPFLSSDGNSAQSTFVGQLAGNFNAGGGDVAAGFSALANNVTGGQNVAVGFQALGAATGVGGSVAIGYGALASVDTGSNNIAIGQAAGGNYTTTEDSNILIGNVGVIGDLGVIRIGENGTQASAFLQGAYGITPANSPLMMTVGSDGELGSQAIPAGAGLTWSEVTGSTQAMAVNNGYILNNAGGVVATLPATAAVGDTMRIAGKGSGGWTLAQNSGQLVQFGSQVTTTGVGGSIMPLGLPADQYSALELLCITANTTFEVISSVGNFTVT